MHLESTLLTPAELARMIVPHGTTAVISDSHEIGNVLGIPGIDLIRMASVGLPLDLFLHGVVMRSSHPLGTRRRRSRSRRGA